MEPLILSFFKDVKLLQEYRFRYKLRISGRQGLAETREMEAIVKDTSFEKAKKALEKTLLDSHKICITFLEPGVTKEKIDIKC